MVKKILSTFSTVRLKLALVFLPVIAAVLTMQPAWAEEDCVETTFFGCVSNGEGNGVFLVLNVALGILTFGVGIAGTVGLIVSGVQYLTAGDNEQNIAKAKSRIFQIVIGLAIYAVMWGVLQWLLPGIG